MRRKDREITETNEILSIMKKCDCCMVALNNGEYPYVVPLNFGLRYLGDELFLYFHSANTGKKIELIKNNGQAAFAMSTSHNLILSDVACKSTMEYESVCGTGTIRFLDDNEKTVALSYIMEHYSCMRQHILDENIVSDVCVLEMKVINITGKRNLRKGI